ncbi:hypothetical protein GGF39_003271 [Coemansia sp. RSA 1721]|nr:hypothetical protein GGF39_003271 [Coemansia sp. RSA 1721]
MSPNTFTTAFELLGAAPAPASGPEWLELFDPHTNRVVYANIVTGQCSWTRPDSSM